MRYWDSQIQREKKVWSGGCQGLEGEGNGELT